MKFRWQHSSDRPTHSTHTPRNAQLPSAQPDELTRECTEIQETARSQNGLEKQERSLLIPVSQFQTLLPIHGHQEGQTDRSTEKNRESRHQLSHLRSIDFQRGDQAMRRERRVCPRDGAGAAGHPATGNGIRPDPHRTPHRTQH